MSTSKVRPYFTEMRGGLMTPYPNSFKFEDIIDTSYYEKNKQK